MNEQAFRIGLGKVIRGKRLKLGFTQETFADYVGLHRTYIGAIERGERNVSLGNLIKISASLQIPLSFLISEAEKILEGDC